MKRPPSKNRDDKNTKGISFEKKGSFIIYQINRLLQINGIFFANCAF
jgi:hypothetical protein